MLKSIRVGLSLKRRVFAPNDPSLKYLLRSYRYLTDPRRTKKGKPQVVLPLIADGMSADEVNRITGCPPAAVRRYAAAYAAGKTERSAEPYYGTEMSTADLCRLYGWWRERKIRE